MCFCTSFISVAAAAKPACFDAVPTCCGPSANATPDARPTETNIAPSTSFEFIFSTSLLARGRGRRDAGTHHAMSGGEREGDQAPAGIDVEHDRGAFVVHPDLITLLAGRPRNLVPAGAHLRSVDG